MDRIHELINKISLLANNETEDLLELIHDLLCAGIPVNDFRRVVSACLVVGYHKSNTYKIDPDLINGMIERAKIEG